MLPAQSSSFLPQSTDKHIKLIRPSVLVTPEEATLYSQRRSRYSAGRAPWTSSTMLRHVVIVPTRSLAHPPENVKSPFVQSTASRLLSLTLSSSKSRATKMAWREGLLFKIVNVGSYSLFSWSNYYAIASPHSVYGNIKQTYFTPAVWAFFAWPIVHFLLLGTIIYQFTSAHAKATVIDRISWWFPILTILNSIFVAVWAYDYSIAAFVLSFFVFWAVNRIYFIKKDHSPESLGDAFFVHLPFSTWHGWAVVNIFFTAFEAFGTDATIRPADIPTEVGVFLSL